MIQQDSNGSERILVVEDEAQIRRLVAEILDLEGYDVVTAEGGEDALMILDAAPQPFDLLITDIVMSGMSGKRLSEQTQGTYPTMKVLYMSGYPENASILHHVNVKGQHFLQKPFSPTSLADKVREVLDAQ